MPGRNHGGRVHTPRQLTIMAEATSPASGIFPSRQRSSFKWRPKFRKQSTSSRSSSPNQSKSTLHVHLQPEPDESDDPPPIPPVKDYNPYESFHSFPEKIGDSSANMKGKEKEKDAASVAETEPQPERKLLAWTKRHETYYIPDGDINFVVR